MSVNGLLNVTLDVPDLAAGIKFYTDANLRVTTEGNNAKVHCGGKRHASIVLQGGSQRKRLHHLTLGAKKSDFPSMRAAIASHGGRIIEPTVRDNDGLWLEDPHGMLMQIADVPDEHPDQTDETFTINAPGKILRKNRSAMLRRAQNPRPVPLRLGHVMVFTPDVDASVAFFRDALGMRLADHVQDVIAFMCCKSNSDHHVVAFAKSNGVGLHHASFQVASPDDVGRAGAALAASVAGGNWGFGRHTIGSNFFHYVQDPWGSWLEYFCDMDFIEDYSVWSPTNYPLEDSLANWGPPVPHDFVHNYETQPL